MKPRQTRFTLVELLVVITIIAILAGILIPTIATAIKKAHIGKAKAEMTSLMAAITLYQSEYDVMPFAYASGSESVELTSARYDVLISFLSQTGTADDPETGNPAQDTGNARKIKMLNVKKAATYLDPWDKRYHIVYDCNYDDEILVDDIVGLYKAGTTIPYTVVIWSEGPDEASSGTANNKANRDNVYTIETNWSTSQGHVIP